MQEYASKDALIDEIQKTAGMFIKEFDDLLNPDRDIRFDEVNRTPGEIISYQLGWMSLIREWDCDESEGREVIMPAPGYKWNQLGRLYQNFYHQYQDQSLDELRDLFVVTVDALVAWLNAFSDDELFQPGGRKWAASTPSNWPIWKWIHINTVAPFKSFRSKIRKWKKLRATI